MNSKSKILTVLSYCGAIVLRCYRTAVLSYCSAIVLKCWNYALENHFLQCYRTAVL